MGELRVRGERRVRPGCLAEFTAAVGAAMDRHHRLDGPGTLEFVTYLDEANDRWIALERYADSAAMLAHLAVRSPEISDTIGRLSDIVYTEVYGVPSSELAGMLAAMGDAVAVFSPLHPWRTAIA